MIMTSTIMIDMIMVVEVMFVNISVDVEWVKELEEI